MRFCRGVFGPCDRPATHEFVAPDGTVPLCKEHWEWSENLVKALKEDRGFAREFEAAVEDAERTVQ